MAVDKPAGFHVHPPEDQAHRIPLRESCLHLLRDQLGRYVYPIHRLDRATSGVLVFALDPESARELSRQFQEREARKVYVAVARGWLPPQGVIDHALQSDSSLERREAVTRFETIAQRELPEPVGRYPTARYSLVAASPLTGRMHQLRRHFVHVSHPLIGDTVYGDGKHNAFFKERLGIPGLLLKAQLLELRHPRTGSTLLLRSEWHGKWHRVFELFGLCPLEQEILNN